LWIAFLPVLMIFTRAGAAIGLAVIFADVFIAR
jgi:hypothetical protein